MPLVGFEDDDRVRVTLKECWKLESFGGLPVEILYRIWLTYSANNRPDGLTVTGLLGCARKSCLEKREDYYANPRFLYALFRGTMVHEMLEGTNQLFNKPDIIFEKRYHRKIPRTNIMLSGKLDKYMVVSKCLQDYKTIADEKVARLAKELPEDYIWQANIYKWIMEGNGFEIDRIKIIFIGWKYAYTTGEKCLISARWTDPKWITIPECPIYTTEQVEDFIYHRAKDITRKAMPPVISSDKRWICVSCPFKQTCWPEEEQIQ